MTPRTLLLVGTDTEAGKTAVACAVLAAARERGLVALPFKPAESGTADLPPDATDAARLCAAAGLDPAWIPRIAPLRYPAPLAPGIAHDPAPFVAGAAPDPTPLRRAVAAAEALCTPAPPDLLVVEPAGGLFVPMPGGTWQPDWIAALARAAIPPLAAVVVGRAGLGTINHTILTRRALADLRLPVLGFLLSETVVQDPSAADNPSVLARATGLPHLGTLPHGARRLPAPAATRLFDALAAAPTA